MDKVVVLWFFFFPYSWNILFYPLALEFFVLLLFYLFFVNCRKSTKKIFELLIASLPFFPFWLSFTYRMNLIIMTDLKRTHMESKFSRFEVPALRVVSEQQLGVLKVMVTQQLQSLAALSVIGFNVGVDVETICSTIEKKANPPLDAPW